MLNAEKILLAVGDVSDDLIEAAALPAAPVRRARPARRLAVCLLAAALLIASLATAMAVSGGFRAAVYAFFHLTAVETGAPADAGGTPVSAALGDGVRAVYLQLDSVRDCANGVIRLQDGSALALRDGALVPVRLRETTAAVTWDGTVFRVDLFWQTGDGALALFAEGKTAADDRAWSAVPLGSRTDAVALLLSAGRQEARRERFLLLDLETGATSDPLALCGADGADFTFESGAPDGGAALLRRGEALFLCDLRAHTLRDVDALAGAAADAAWFVSADTLACRIPADGGFAVLTVPLGGGAPAARFSGLREYAAGSGGMIFTGGRYGLDVAAGGSAAVCDFLTGTRTPIADFAFDANAFVGLSPAGTRLLFARFGGEDGLGLTQLGLLDLETGRFRAFDRAAGECRPGESLGWFDRRSPLLTSAGGALTVYRFS